MHVGQHGYMYTCMWVGCGTWLHVHMHVGRTRGTWLHVHVHVGRTWDMAACIHACGSDMGHGCMYTCMWVWRGTWLHVYMPGFSEKMINLDVQCY